MSTRSRRRGRPLCLLLAVGPGVLACASLRAPLAPAPLTDEAAIDMERGIMEETERRLTFDQDAVLRLEDGPSVTGTAIVEILGLGSAERHPVEFRRREIYRCGEGHAIERGTYRMTHQLGTLPAEGRWHAVWRHDASGAWAIREAMLFGLSAYPPLPGGCVSAAREAWSANRLTLSFHGWPLAFSTADPLAGSGSFSGFAGMVGARWRFGSWATAGGYGGRDWRIRTSSRSRPAGSSYVESAASFLAVVGGYEGRNVTLDAGPVWLRSTWSWLDDQGRTVTEARYGRPGAVVTLRGALPAGRNMSADLLLQYRLFGSEAVPYSSPRILADRSGLFISLGLGLRAMP